MPEESASLARTLHGQNQKASQSNNFEEEKENTMPTNRRDQEAIAITIGKVATPLLTDENEGPDTSVKNKSSRNV